GRTDALPSDATDATHVYTATGPYTIQVSVTDVNGPHAPPSGVTFGTKAISAVVSAGGVSAGGPYALREGDDLVLTATADGAPTSAQWDLKGFSTFADGSAPFTSNGDGTSTSTLRLHWSDLQALGLNDGTPAGVIRFDTRVKALYPTSVVAAGFLTSPATTL